MELFRLVRCAATHSRACLTLAMREINFLGIASWSMAILPEAPNRPAPRWIARARIHAHERERERIRRELDLAKQQALETLTDSYEEILAKR